MVSLDISTTRGEAVTDIPMLERQRADPAGEVTVESLRRFKETFADLADPEVMRSAWS